MANRLEHRHQVSKIADFLLEDQNVSVVQFAIAFGRSRDEVGRNEAFVELHSVNEADRCVDRLAFFDSDHTVFADLLQGVGQQVSDRIIVVGTDGTDIGDVFAALDRLGHAEQLLDGSVDRLLDSTSNGHRVTTGNDVAATFAEDRAGEHGRRGGSVASDIGCLGGDFVHELGAHVLEAIFQFGLPYSP